MPRGIDRQLGQERDGEATGNPENSRSWASSPNWVSEGRLRQRRSIELDSDGHRTDLGHEGRLSGRTVAAHATRASAPPTLTRRREIGEAEHLKSSGPKAR
jgi:hypothetical protein